MPRRIAKRIGGLSAAAALMLGGAWPWAMPATAAPTTETFEFTNGPQTFEVPANVCQITVDAHGAQGGEGGPSDDGAGEGALGGRATTPLSVTPGETLTVVVGGQGGEGSGPAATSTDAGGPGESVRFGNGGAAGLGGFNGGGPGGFNSSPDEEDHPIGGGGGGGASDLRRGGTRLVMAGGGGGGGVGDGDAPTPGGDGGAGGGLTGEDGETPVNPDSPPDPPGSEGGKGGTQSEGGAGGDGGSAGEQGTASAGGTGGSGDEEAGGGGGGGFMGGGGGAGDFDENPVDIVSAGGGKSVPFPNGFEDSEAGGGGGGGSGFGPADVAFETGVQEGDGVVTITYDPENGGCPPAPQPAAVPVAAVARFTG